MQTKLVGQVLYYLLTTGSGQQTLGEEYCDITQVFLLPYCGCIFFSFMYLKEALLCLTSFGFLAGFKLSLANALKFFYWLLAVN